jgi:adenine C2-methylase RlmN of 23S rRNA A2503 and tRNA A37
MTAAMTMIMTARSDAQEIEQLLRADLQNSSHIIETVHSIQIESNAVSVSTIIMAPLSCALLQTLAS